MAFLITSARHYSKLLYSCNRHGAGSIIRQGNRLWRAQCRTEATYTSPFQANQISIIQSKVDKSSTSFQENDQAVNELCGRFEKLHKDAAEGGPLKARDKHVQRGKMLVRE